MYIINLGGLLDILSTQGVWTLNEQQSTIASHNGKKKKDNEFKLHSNQQLQ